jgi:glutamate dehydrogenase
MGITARGAFVSLARLARECGFDPYTTPFSMVGIGDMSGDVFGNGLLQSPHTRLQALPLTIAIFLSTLHLTLH